MQFRKNERDRERKSERKQEGDGEGENIDKTKRNREWEKKNWSQSKRLTDKMKKYRENNKEEEWIRDVINKKETVIKI